MLCNIHCQLHVFVAVTTVGDVRIYVKRVKKFVEYAINLNTTDKKAIKIQMDNAFEELKRINYRAVYQERYYVQLPTVNAHENHVDGESLSSGGRSGVKLSSLTSSFSQSAPQQPDVKLDSKTTSSGDSRLHPLVQEKIRQLVAAGETKLYAIRKHLRSVTLFLLKLPHRSTPCSVHVHVHVHVHVYLVTAGGLHVCLFSQAVRGEGFVYGTGQCS